MGGIGGVGDCKLFSLRLTLREARGFQGSSLHLISARHAALHAIAGVRTSGEMHSAVDASNHRSPPTLQTGATTLTPRFVFSGSIP